MPELREDLSQGEDCRRDIALFLEEEHIQKNGWDLDVDVGPEPVFIRIIRSGRETSCHGWSSNKEVFQWG